MKPRGTELKKLTWLETERAKSGFYNFCPFRTLFQDWHNMLCFFSCDRTPLSMAVWSLTCFFVSASSNKWIRALYPIKCSFVFSHYRLKTHETLDIIGGFCTHSDRLNCPWVIIVNININSAFHFFHPLNLCEEALRSQNFVSYFH